MPTILGARQLWTGNPDLLTFAINRALRIFPALIVGGLVVGWVVLPLSTGRGLDYFSDPHGLWYPLNVTWMFEEAHLHGAFAFSSFPQVINLPLWSIKFELLAYAGMGLATALGLFRKRELTLSIAVGFGLALTVLRSLDLGHDAFFGSAVRLGFCFLVGVSAYQYRGLLRLDGRVALAAIAVAMPLGLTVLGPVAWIVTAAYGALVLSSLEVPILVRATRRTDISYGIYLYTWPIQQLLTQQPWSPDLGGVALHLVSSLLCVIPIALLSWQLIEQPAIRLKRRSRGSFSKGKTEGVHGPPDPREGRLPTTK